MHCFMLCLVQSSEGWGSSTAADRSRCKGWNPGTLFLQLLDGSDRPWAGRAEGTGTFPSQHKALVEQDCSPRPGWELEQLPFCCSWLSYEAELQGNCTFCGCKPLHQGPSVTGHQISSPRHSQKQMQVPWQWHTASLCHIPFSCFSLWFLSCSSEKVF